MVQKPTDMKKDMNKCHNRAALIVMIIALLITWLLSGCAVSGHYSWEKPYTVTDTNTGTVYDNVYPVMQQGAVTFKTDSSVVWLSHYTLIRQQ
jgi:hypothetical protein